MEPLQPGDPTRIASYEILNRLGAGGMGQVYLGRSASGRRVAVKVIRPELTSDAEFRARFRREVASMKAVSGFFTAPVVDADPDGTPAWLATAYVPGPSLSEAVRDRGPMPQADVLVLAAGLAEALSAIHREGLTHRDLKPANVLLADDGPRVIDFGLAVTAQSSAVTQAGTVVGTPSFMSPEQISGKQVGPASDVFSLGSVLVHAATGRAPYGEGGTMELMYRVVNNEPDLTGVSGLLHQLVSACLQKDPGLRPSPARILQVLSDGAGVQATAAMGWVPPKLAQPQGAPYVAPPTVAGGHQNSGPNSVPPHTPLISIGPDPTRRDSDPRGTMPVPGPYGPGHNSGGPYQQYQPVPKKNNNKTMLAVGGGAVGVAAVVVAVIALSGGGGGDNPGPGPGPATTSSTLAKQITPGQPITVDLTKLMTPAEAAKALKAPQSDISVGSSVDDNGPPVTHDQSYDVRAGTSSGLFLNSFRIQATLYDGKNVKKAQSDYSAHTSDPAFAEVQIAGVEKATMMVVSDPSDTSDNLQKGTLEMLRGNLDITVTFQEMKVDAGTARGDLAALAAVIAAHLPN